MDSQAKEIEELRVDDYQARSLSGTPLVVFPRVTSSAASRDQTLVRGETETRSMHGKMKGIIGVMRKLARAIWHVSHTAETFDWSKVFPGRPLTPAAHEERNDE